MALRRTREHAAPRLSDSPERPTPRDHLFDTVNATTPSGQTSSNAFLQYIFYSWIELQANQPQPCLKHRLEEHLMHTLLAICLLLGLFK